MKKYRNKIGSYKILEELGKGGMAKVYTALQPSLSRIVVIKEMIKSSQDSKIRFKNEARLLASINQENIMQIYDYVTIGSNHYLVMEYIDGMSLENILKFGPLDQKSAGLIARGVLAGLEHAHRKNIIHRDIKPANVLLSKDGVVKLTDFGIAKGVTSPNLTTTGMIVGTPYYLAPEVAFGEKASILSDIYSVGVILYEMVTGRKPFSGQTTRALMENIGKGKFPSPYWHARDRSLRLSRIIEKAMHRHSEKRYKSTKKMLDALDQVIGHKNIVHSNEFLSEVVKDLLKCSEKTTIKIKKEEESQRRIWWLALIPIAIVVIWFIYQFLITKFIPK